MRSLCFCWKQLTFAVVVSMYVGNNQNSVPPEMSALAGGIAPQQILLMQQIYQAGILQAAQACGGIPPPHAGEKFHFFCHDFLFRFNIVVFILVERIRQYAYQQAMQAHLQTNPSALNALFAQQQLNQQKARAQQQPQVFSCHHILDFSFSVHWGYEVKALL